MEKTNTKIKRFVSLLVACVMLISMVPSVFATPAEQFSDFPTGWSKPAMEAAVNNGLLVGIGDGEIGPQKYLTRAEMAAVMVRAFGATTYADISKYSDLDPNSWYYNYVACAVKMGALTGISGTEMAPNDYITREQVFSVLARILALSGDNQQALAKFNDGNQVSSWALNTIIPMVERGYVNGDGFGNLNPQDLITREEFAQVMYETIKRYITVPGTYSENMNGIVVIRCGNVTLNGAYIEGDLVVGDGAAKNLVTLDGTTVNGRLLTRGGTNHLKASVINSGVVVLNPNGITPFRNYRTEIPFNGIIELTVASFLTNGSSAPGSSSGTEKHDVVFKLFDSDTEAYKEIRVNDGSKIGNKMPDDPEATDIPGYTFNGWLDENGDAVTEDTRVYGDMTVVADLTPVTPPTTYEVIFKLFDTDLTPYATVTVEEGQTIGIWMPADPAATDIPGYTFNGWVDGVGNPVTATTVITAGMTVVADLTPITHEVIFKLFDTDLTPFATITVVEGQEIGTQMPADPTAVQIPGYTFNGWVDGLGNSVTDLTVVTSGMTVVADLSPIVTPPATITVKFYEGYGMFAPQMGSTLTLPLVGGEASVDAGDIPSYAYSLPLYNKNEYMAPSYWDYDGSVRVSPAFYYYKGGEWLPFDETVVLTEDTTVHLFYKYFGLSGFETEVSTKYTGTTRIIDSVISLSDNAKKQLETARDTNLDIYEKLDGIIYGTLEDKDLIAADRRIKKITIPLPINSALTRSLINDVIAERIDTILDTPTLYDKLFMWPEVEDYLINNGPTLAPGLSIDEIHDEIKTYIDGLSAYEKDLLEDEICDVIFNTDEYDYVTDCVLNNKTLVIDMDNIKLVKEIHKELEVITFDTVMSLSHDSIFDKIADIVGYSTCADIFNEGRARYCEDMEDLIDLVENGISTSESISSEFDLLFDPIEDILAPIYDKAQDKAIEKLIAADVGYNDNESLQYVIEQDIIDELFIDTGIVTEEYSSYALKDIVAYADYAVELEIAVNDALLWYGDLSESEFNVIYEAVLAKAYAASDRLDGILEDFADEGKLPSKIETAITSIQKINDIYMKFEPRLRSIVDKYLNSSIHDSIENGTIDENEKVQTAIDILLGNDDPVFTLDTLFDIFYNYDDKMQDKLQTLLDSGKLDTAIDKFKNSPVGDKISDAAISDIVEILENVAEYGVEYYRVDTSSDKTIVEQYKIEIDGKELILVRKFVF